MYESKSDPLLPGHQFIRRMLAHVAWAAGVICLALGVGVAAHLFLEAVSWHDALLNTALIIGGIGPYILPESVAGKVFFSLYGIVIGLVFAATLGLILAPIAHRVLHAFHLDEDNDET